MSASSSPQTLFRFVSFRNPKLAVTKKTNLGFIHRPDGMEGVFDQVVQTAANSNKFGALQNAATAFAPEAFKTESELETIGFGEILKIAKLNSNQNTFSTNDLKLCKDFYQKLSTNVEAIKKLWDNLIYQVITQKDFYTKENIAHIIKALHIGYVQTLTTNDELKKINGNDLTTKGINAKIVLPHAIFESNNVASAAKNNDASKSLLDRSNNRLAITSNKNQSEQDLSFDKDIFTNLKTALEVIQKKYNNAYARAYKIAFENYTKENLENTKASEQQLSIISELEANKATDEEIKNAYEILKKYDVPAFEFHYKKELNWGDIYTNLTPELFSWFLHNFSDAEEANFKDVDFEKVNITILSDDELAIDGNSIFFVQKNYNEIFVAIDNQTKSLHTQFLNKVVLQQDEFANIAGVLVPIARNNSQVVHLSYVLNAHKRRTFFIQNTNLG